MTFTVGHKEDTEKHPQHSLIPRGLLVHTGFTKKSCRWLVCPVAQLGDFHTWAVGSVLREPWGVSPNITNHRKWTKKAMHCGLNIHFRKLIKLIQPGIRELFLHLNESWSDVVQSGGESTHQNKVGRLWKQLLLVTLKNIKFFNYSVTEWWKWGYF